MTRTRAVARYTLAVPVPANPFKSTRVVVGIGGGIAAYKAAYLVRLLVKAGAEVQVVMSRAANEFVGAATFAALSQRPVFTDLWDLEEEATIGHISVADSADLVIVAPCTANLIARASSGRAADALAAVLLATKAPVLLAPSMNVNMWNHPSTRANLERLISRPGYSTVGPGVGFLACQWQGAGRLAEPAEIFEAAAHVLTPSDLSGRRVVITAGPTREPLDPVRFLSNRSTGKMGYEIAIGASRRGAEVTIVSGPVALPPPLGVEVVSVTTAVQMEQAAIRAADGTDVLIMVAAVGDLRPASVSSQKIKKADWFGQEREKPGDTVNLALAINPDILAGFGKRRAEANGRGPLLVGFAAETENVAANARAKLRAKSVDLMVANDVGAPDSGFGVDTNRVLLVSEAGEIELALASKTEIAHRILDRVVSLLSQGSARVGE